MTYHSFAAKMIILMLLAILGQEVSSKTSVFINPDSPFFVKQTPHGEILLRKSQSALSSQPSFNALNELLDLYLKNQTSPRGGGYNSHARTTTTSRPYYPLFTSTTHGPFFTFSSTDFNQNRRINKDPLKINSRLKPFQVVTLSPYKNIMDDESRNKWPLYNLSSFKGKNKITSKPSTHDHYLSSAIQHFEKEADGTFEDDNSNIIRSDLHTIFEAVNKKHNKRKDPQRVIVNRPDILTISEFLPGPVIVRNDQNKILDTTSTTTTSWNRDSTSSEASSTITSTTSLPPFSLASFVAFEPATSVADVPTTTSTTTTTTELITTTDETTSTTTESSQFGGLSNIFSMISHQMEFISNSFLTKTSTSSEDISVAGSSAASSSGGGGSVLDPSTALIPAVLGGVIGVGLFVSELAKSSSARRRRLGAGGPPRRNYASTKAVDFFPHPSPHFRKHPNQRKMKSSPPLRHSGITQFVAADARRKPQKGNLPGNFYYDYFNSDAFVNTNK